MFKKPKRYKIFHSLVEQIEEAIIQGKIKPGEKLPAERELREQFETSRGSVREALRVLEQKGLITIKVGPAGGAVVKPATTDCAVETLALLIKRRNVPLSDLAEFRVGIESNVVALAAQRATRVDIRMLKDLLAEAKAFMDEGVDSDEAFIDTEKKIHIALSEIANNLVYQFVFQMVHENIHSYYAAIPLRSQKMMEENYRDLHTIVQNVELGLAEEARAVHQRYLRRINRYMEVERNHEKKI
jgi:DNA-binding FadR family transcriptional regulator